MKADGVRSFERPTFQYAGAISVVAVAFMLHWMLVKILHQQLPPHFTFYPAVMIVAVVAGFWPGVFAVVVSVLVVVFAMPGPVGYFVNPEMGKVAQIVFAGMGLLMCVVAERYRRRQRALVGASEKLSLIETQEQLHESESNFQLLANGIPQLCWMANPDGSIFWYNDRWFQYTGTTFEKMQEAGCHSVYAPEYLTRMGALKDSSLVTGAVIELVAPIRAANGQFRLFLTRVVPHKGEDGTVVRWFGTHTDIDDEKKIEADLRSSVQRLEMALEASGLGEWELDLRTNRTNRSLRHCQIFGHDSLPPDLSYEPFVHQLLPEYRAEVLEKVAASRENGMLDYEARIRRADGEIRWIWVRGRHVRDESGDSVRMYGTVQDITDRKQAEDLLKDRKTQLRLFVEQAPVALAMFDRDMCYIVASHRWVIDNGLEGRDLTSLSHYDTNPEMPDNWRESHRRGLRGEVVTNEDDLIHLANGKVRWVRWEVQPWRDPSGDIGGILIFAEDITARKKTEEKLKHVSRIYSMLRDINQAVFREEGSQELLQAACDIAVTKGLFRMAWVGMMDPVRSELECIAHSGNFNDYLSSIRINLDADPSLRGPATRCVCSGEHAVCNDIEHDPNFAPWRCEAMKRGYLSSAAFPIRVNGEVVGVFNLYSAESNFFSDQELVVLDQMALDISYAIEVNQRKLERQKIEDELRWRTAFFEAQLESSPDGILVTDNQGDVIYKNRRFVQMWNFPEEFFTNGKKQHRLAIALSMLKAPNNYEESTNRIFASSDWAGLEEVELLSGTILTRFTSPVNDASGKHYGRIWVFQDITKRRQMEQQLRQSQKMEAVGQLTGGIAHDFNNLLAVILGNLDLLHKMVQSDATSLRRVEIAQRAAERGADVTRRLLAFSRSGELKPVPTPLNVSVREVVEFARTLGPDIRFVTHFDDLVGSVFVDAAGLENALLNLLVNSRDAMPNGGTVTISTELCDVDQINLLVESGQLVSTAYACISVTDTGFGMSKQTQDRVFEPFFTTKSEGKGSGLGLAMVYGFVKQSGGAVRIYSEEGVGTTVTLFLPLADQMTVRPADAHATPSRLIRPTKVLVVDDEQDLVEIMRIYLERMGYEVYEANDAGTALDVVRAHPCIDLLITDIIMPGGINGVELAYDIRELLPKIKIVYSSGFPANSMADRGLPSLDAPMLRKPYTLSEFEAAIRTVME